ncbi:MULTISPECIES: arylsulfatase [unclassified Lentimonas]|uniref:sulfatase family protein n=1 Tax=unclassified Lentimonas TaxID=2630993 RepID=UPI001328E4CF|nr:MULTISPECIES: arylsulfatase [unclassified Lentimonas]CAA6691677.1 Choline-sulfatase (EC [Lentimonas sp. CC19]CAA6695996.1 Choline-sulfatase (EC [Lentimonas sp. CC10]CAA7070031.1 Choline-sulfatase (EC [Lentimonas sp. CC11]
MMKKLLFLASLVLSSVLTANEAQRPNIIFILADDMGYGSVQANNEKCTIPTPNLNRLVEEGMNFTDAHSDSSVCTPSRYGLMTGRYSWRSGLKSGVTWGFFPALIEPEIETVAEVLRDAGYDTGMIGKWHIGIDFTNKQGQTIAEEMRLDQHLFVNCADFQKVNLRYDWRKLDFTQPIKGGPVDHGFNYYFGDDIPNMPPYVFYRDNMIVDQPTETKPKKMFGIAGPMTPGWTLEAVMPALAADAERYIAEKAHQDEPFFLYFSLNSPHTPIAPSDEFKGKSGLNLYADWIIQTDAAVGTVLEALDAQGIAENTLVIFSTDNGSTGKELGELKKMGCDLTHQFRGQKRSIYEGGHRVPYIVRWPKVTPAGSSNDTPICLNDFLATSAAIAGVKLDENTGPDSHNILPLYEGKERAENPAVIHHDFDGGYAIRRGDWKLVFQLDRKNKTFTRELYNMSDDVKETTDVLASSPEVAAQLEALFKNQVRAGRSTPGPQQANVEDPDWLLPF